VNGDPDVEGPPGAPDENPDDSPRWTPPNGPEDDPRLPGPRGFDVEPIRVLVIDAQDLFRRDMVTLLGVEKGIEIVGEAGDVVQGTTIAARSAPDVVLLDLRIFKRSGNEAVAAIKQVVPTAKIIMLTISDEEADLHEAVTSGASGYLLKDSSLEEVAQAVRVVNDSQSLISSSTAVKVIEEFKRMPRPERDHVQRLRLTDRELEVLRLIAKGLNTPEIAEQLFVSESTVKNQVRNIRRELARDPFGRSLLAVARREDARGSSTGVLEASSPAMRRVPEWFTEGWSVAVPESLAHAAASAGSMPEVFTRTWEDLPGVTLVGRGSSTEFALIVVVDSPSAQPRDLIRLRVIFPDTDTPLELLVPLGRKEAEGRLVGSVLCPQPRRVIVFEPVRGLPEHPNDIALIRESFRAAEGNTRDTWLDIAQELPEASPVREAIIEALLS